MLLGLTGPGAAAHADVLDGAAKSGHLVALEVGQRDEHVGVHHRPADLGLLHVLAAHHGYLHIVGALQTVADEDGAAHSQGRKAVLPGALQVLQGVLPAAGIHGVAVGEEGLATQLLHHVHHRTGVVGSQIADVAQLAEVHLDGDKLALQVQIGDTGPLDQLFQLSGQAVAKGLSVKISKINFGYGHDFFPSLIM